MCRSNTDIFTKILILQVANTGKDEVESREVIVIDRNVDNIYKNTNTHEIIEGNRTITLEKNNLPDTGM